MQLDAQINPEKIVFTRDIFINVPVITDLIAIRQRHQLLIDQILMQYNRKIYNYKYRIGKQGMIKVYNLING